MRIGWDLQNRFDRMNQSADFPTFVRNTFVHFGIRRCVGAIYRGCLQAGNRRVDFVGRQESLADDLVRALRTAGEEFDEEKLRSTPQENTTDGDEDLTQRSIFPPALAAEVLLRERETLREYGYADYFPVHDAHTVFSVGSPQRGHSVNVLEGCRC